MYLDRLNVRSSCLDYQRGGYMSGAGPGFFWPFGLFYVAVLQAKCRVGI